MQPASVTPGLGVTDTVPAGAGIAVTLTDPTERAVHAIAADLIAVSDHYGLDRDARRDIARCAMGALRRIGMGPDSIRRFLDGEQDVDIDRLLALIDDEAVST